MNYSRPPKRVLVGGDVYKIKVVKNLKTSNTQEEAFGQIMFQPEQEISLDANIGPARAHSTMIHELLHAVWRGWHNPANLQQDEEAFVFAMAAGLSAVFFTNPELVAWLNQMRKEAYGRK